MVPKGLSVIEQAGLKLATVSINSIKHFCLQIFHRDLVACCLFLTIHGIRKPRVNKIGYTF